MQLRNVLLLKQVVPALKGDNRTEAISELLQTLRGDSRILESEAFVHVFLKQLAERNDFAVLEGGLLIPHVRTDLVSNMLMAFGRLAQPIEDGAVRYIMIVAIPHAMASEYLRIVGGICRVFKSSMGKLDQAQSASALLDELAKI